MGVVTRAKQRPLVVDDVFVIEIGPRHTVWLRGPRAGHVLQRLELARVYDHEAGTWSFSRNRVDEVLRDLRRRRRYVDVVEVDR